MFKEPSQVLLNVMYGTVGLNLQFICHLKAYYCTYSQLAEYIRRLQTDCNVECLHANLSPCITGVDPLRSLLVMFQQK